MKIQYGKYHTYFSSHFRIFLPNLRSPVSEILSTRHVIDFDPQPVFPRGPRLLEGGSDTGNPRRSRWPHRHRSHVLCTSRVTCLRNSRWPWAGCSDCSMADITEECRRRLRFNPGYYHHFLKLILLVLVLNSSFQHSLIFTLCLAWLDAMLCALKEAIHPHLPTPHLYPCWKPLSLRQLTNPQQKNIIIQAFYFLAACLENWMNLSEFSHLYWAIDVVISPHSVPLCMAAFQEKGNLPRLLLPLYLHPDQSNCRVSSP